MPQCSSRRGCSTSLAPSAHTFLRLPRVPSYPKQIARPDHRAAQQVTACRYVLYNTIFSVAGCGTNAQARVLCGKHGANGICLVLGCDTTIQARDLCGKHGSNGICSVLGCGTSAVARGLCVRHGANGICSVAGCGNNIQARGLCGTWSLCKARSQEAQSQKAQCQQAQCQQVWCHGHLFCAKLLHCWWSMWLAQAPRRPGCLFRRSNNRLRMSPTQDEVSRCYFSSSGIGLFSLGVSSVVAHCK